MKYAAFSNLALHSDRIRAVLNQPGVGRGGQPAARAFLPQVKANSDAKMRTVLDCM